jgi:bifunctional non-homologous end joining protein LigD
MPAILTSPSGFVEPMQCLPVPSVPTGEGWLYEIKWDGRRVIGMKVGRTRHLFSATGECLDDEFPEMLEALSWLNCRSAIVDGEIIAWDENGRPSPEELVRKDHPRVLHMAVFDLLMLEGRDLTGKPLMLRRAALNAILPPEGGSLMSFSRELQGQPDLLLMRAKELQIGGIIAKQRDSVYECGERSASWLKCEVEEGGQFLIGGYVPGDHGFEELIIGEPGPRGLRFVARLRAGFMPATRSRIFADIEPLGRRDCPFMNLPERASTPSPSPLDSEQMKLCRWTTPRVSVGVAYSHRTPYGRLRQARFARG